LSVALVRLFSSRPMAAYGAYQPIPFPTTKVRSATRKQSLRQAVSGRRSV